jgi:hypothetical protein
MNSAENKDSTGQGQKGPLDGKGRDHYRGQPGDRRVHRQDLRRAVEPKYARAYLKFTEAFFGAVDGRFDTIESLVRGSSDG